MSARMSDEDIRALIVARLQNNRCNDYYINHLMGQLRGLVAALTGEAPPSTHNGDVRPLLKMAGIPYNDHGDGEIDFPEDWCRAHGFEIAPEGWIRHPRWSFPW